MSCILYSKPTIKLICDNLVVKTALRQDGKHICNYQDWQYEPYWKEIAECNLRAYCHRYREDIDTTRTAWKRNTSVDSEFESLDPLSLAQVFMALRRIDYQCGDINRDDDYTSRYESLDKLEYTIAKMMSEKLLLVEQRNKNTRHGFTHIA